VNSHPPEIGKWPNPVNQFWWDLIPDKFAPSNSGVLAPDYVEPAWLGEPIANEELVVETTRKAREEAESRAGVAETKASRLVQVALALLAIAITIGGYQLGYVREHTAGALWLLLLPVILAIFFLAWAAIIALEIDRPGVYYQPDAAHLAPGPSTPRTRAGLEERGRQLADWTARNKVSALLDARSRFSRGLVALVISAILASVTISAGDPFSTVKKPAAHPAPTATAATRVSPTH
jgi:hypothetical protein